MKEYIADLSGAKVISEGLYIPGLKTGVFRPSALPIEIKVQRMRT
jgi:hypothetical protein